MVPIKEFSLTEETEPVPFKIGGDVFHAVPAGRLPALAQLRYSQQVGAGNLYEAHVRFFRDALEDECIDKFLDRLDSKGNPINLHTMAEVANWLIGDLYAGNPTAPSSP